MVDLATVLSSGLVGGAVSLTVSLTSAGFVASQQEASKQHRQARVNASAEVLGARREFILAVKEGIEQGSDRRLLVTSDARRERLAWAILPAVSGFPKHKRQKIVRELRGLVGDGLVEHIADVWGSSHDRVAGLDPEPPTLGVGLDLRIQSWVPGARARGKQVSANFLDGGLLAAASTNGLDDPKIAAAEAALEQLYKLVTSRRYVLRVD